LLNGFFIVIQQLCVLAQAEWKISFRTIYLLAKRPSIKKLVGQGNNNVIYICYHRYISPIYVIDKGCFVCLWLSCRLAFLTVWSYLHSVRTL